ncbi:transient receptor potential cation channel subfamily V member 1-like [Tachysurus vachellii]|uniref:transient receptor potential cation channel subfamily V member 1-like n=1 Tax=Tachysurus vachellii TaxID=175792 RepID=UPI00296B0C41|nr:transient receptor potential cation channel subfamily V member 1-like [Tachysurus vachellii]
MATFKIGIDDRTDEERKMDKEMEKGASDLPMDTFFQEDHANVKPEVKINLSNVKKLVKRSDVQSQDKRFDPKTLLDAVVSGDVTRLQGLEEYLNKNYITLMSECYKSDEKTVLMKALLNLKDGNTETVEYLLSIAEKTNDLDKLVNAERTHSSYKGQTALHIAIERRNKRCAELLIQKGADVHAKACGTFFQPLSETCFYFGELPLSLAACTNQKDIVDLLMEKADVRLKDTLGNTVLHALVMVADNSPVNTDFIISMYDYILTKDAAKNPEKERLEDIENNQGLTSIKLAAKLGKIGLLEHILHREFQQEECRRLSRRFTEWAYGPVSGSVYDLDSIDTYKPNSVLEIVVYGSEIPNRLEMLQIEPLNKLLEDKWKRFAKWMFLIQFMMYLFYLIIFTAVCYHREEGTPPFPIKKNLKGYLMLAGYIIMAFGSLYFLIVVMLGLKKKRPSLQAMLVDGYSDLLFLFQAGLFVTCMVLYFCGRQQYLAFLVLSLAMSWINLLYFSRGSQNMGIYNIMIQKIFLGDLLRFLFVYVVFLVGFSAALVTLLNEPTEGWPSVRNNTNVTIDCKKPYFKTISCTFLELFKFTIGIGDLEFTEDYEFGHVFYVLLISYIVLTYILLLNMLIALMSKNVDDMFEKSTSIWKLQRAITILDLERYAFGLKKKLRSGVKRKMDNTDRWFLRVEEVNWKDFQSNLGIVSEDPGKCNTPMPPESYREPSQQRLEVPAEEEALLASVSV